MRGLDLNVRSESKNLLCQLDDALRVRPHRAGTFVHEAGQGSFKLGRIRRK